MKEYIWRKLTRENNSAKSKITKSQVQGQKC